MTGSWSPDRVRALLAPIPATPGVYLMRDAQGAVLYVGKARILSERVPSYFAGHDPRPFVALLSRVLDRIDTVSTRTEKEALILENELIKRHKPPFNILLKDDKNYLYLRLDPGIPFPRLELVRRRRDDGALYFGPHHTASSIRGTHALVNRHFGLRTCRDTEFRNRARPCLEHQMRRCLGPCVGGGAAEAYRERVQDAVLFLRGRYDDVRRQLRDRMASAADAENYEEAGRIRDQLKAIDASLSRQAVVLPTLHDTDAVGFSREGDCVAFAVLRFEAGVLSERIPYVLEGVVAPDEDLAESFLVQYYGRAPVPAELLLPPILPEGGEALAQVLEARAGHVVGVRTSPRGPAGDAVKMANANAETLLKEAVASGRTRDRASGRLAELLGLPRAPRRIEGWDMSQFQASEPVGARVVFTDGRPDRQAYRTYAVRAPEGAGDPGMMAEVLQRRFAKSDDGALPDLLLLDGGEAQLGAALAVLASLDLDRIPVVAIAKSRVIGKSTTRAEHSPERLYLPVSLPGPDPVPGVREAVSGSGIRLVIPPQNDPGLHLLVRVRDEVHRFVVAFHRKRRAKRESASVLDRIPGLGKKRRVILLRRFGSVAGLRQASLDELRAVTGIPAPVAEAVFETLHQSQG
jgi:excinuclease ABC subunit C